MSNESGCKCTARGCLPSNKLDNNKVKSQDNSECDWWINSPDHNFCFWTYVKDKSGPDGSMPELVQAEIAALLGWSNTKTHFTLKESMAELIEALKKNNARELLAQDYEDIVDVPNTENLMYPEDSGE